MSPQEWRRPLDSRRELESHPALFEERRKAWMHKQQLPFQRRSLLLQLGIFVLVLVVWQVPIVNPVKLLVVLFHEMSHVVAGYASGAVIFGIAIDPGGAGVTLGMGGSRLLVLLAGYVGSFAMGALLYGLSAVWKPGEVWVVLSVFSASSLVMGWLNGFTAVFGVGTMVLMVLGLVIFSESTQSFLLRIVATASCLYPVIDVAGEFLSLEGQGFVVGGVSVGSDVLALSRLTGIPWGVLASVWVLAGLVMLPLLVTWSARKEATTEVRGQLFRRARAKQPVRHRLYDPNDPDSIPEYTIH